jgi:hypothetical protein
MPRERKYTPSAQDARDYPEDFNEVVENGGRPLHAHFAEWVADKTEADSYFKTAKELTAFKLGAQFGIRYRMDHQAALDGAHAFHEDEAAARSEAASEKAKRPTRTRKAAAEVEEDEPTPAPKRRGRPPRAAAAPAEEEAPAQAPRRGRRPGTPANGGATERTTRRPAATGRAGRPARRTAKTEPEF